MADKLIIEDLTNAGETATSEPIENEAAASAIAVPEQEPPAPAVEKQKKPPPADLKEYVDCPDCGKTISTHSLKYTHKRYCKKGPRAEPIAAATVEEPPPPTVVEPTEVMVSNYLYNQRMANIHRRTSQYRSIAMQGLPS